MCSTSTRTGLTDRCINARPQAPLPHSPQQPSGRCGETCSAASYTSTCRSHDLTGFSAPAPGRGRSAAARPRARAAVVTATYDEQTAGRGGAPVRRAGLYPAAEQVLTSALLLYLIFGQV